MKNETLSDKRKDSYTVEDLEEGLYKGKDVREFIQKFKEYLTWLDNQFQCASHTHNIIRKEIDKLAGEELANHSPQEKSKRKYDTTIQPEDTQKGCGKYIEKQDRHCGNTYGFKSDYDKRKHFVNVKGDSGTYICPKCSGDGE